MSKKFQMWIGAAVLVIAGVVSHNPALIGAGAQMATEASSPEA